MSSRADVHYKPACPFCAGSYGAPNMVTMRSQHRTIAYVCGACKNTWTENIDYVSALALGWPVKPDKAEAAYENGLLRIEVSFKHPMEDAVKIAIKPGGAEIKTRSIVA